MEFNGYVISLNIWVVIGGWMIEVMIGVLGWYIVENVLVVFGVVLFVGVDFDCVVEVFVFFMFEKGCG